MERINQQTVAIREDVEVIKEHTREMKRRGTATEKETNAILRHAEAIKEHAGVIDDTTAATKAIALVRPFHPCGFISPSNLATLFQGEAAEARERGAHIVILHPCRE